MVNIEKMQKKIEAEIKKCEKKKFKVLFYVYDTKGTPSASLTMIYNTALVLKEEGYNVQMLYTDKEFVGPEAWLGEKFAILPHHNTEKGNVDISPADILFIPEVCASIMVKTKDLPCKRIALLNNMKYLTDTTPHGFRWDQMGIRECITISDSLKEHIVKYFPHTKVDVVSPFIDPMFTAPESYKKPIINIISNDQSKINEFVKPFIWLWNVFSWVPIRPTNGLNKEVFAKVNKEASIVVWLDKDCTFGYSALEAMACGCMVAGLIPERIPEWMGNNEKLELNGLWCNNVDELQDIVANMMVSFLHNENNETLYKNMKETVNKYSYDSFKENVKKVYEGVFESRLKELQIAHSALNKKDNTEVKNEE